MAPPTPFPSNTGRGPAQLPVRGKRQRGQVHFKESKAGSLLQAPGSAPGSSEQTHLWMGKLKLREAMNLLKPSLPPKIEDTRGRRVGVEWPPSISHLHCPEEPDTTNIPQLVQAGSCAVPTTCLGLPGPQRAQKQRLQGRSRKKSPHPHPRRAQTRVASRIWLQGQDHRDQDTQTGVPAQS